MQILFILLSCVGGVGPESLVPQVLVIELVFTIAAALIPRTTPKQLAIGYCILFTCASLLMLYEKGYGMIALVGMVSGIVLSMGTKNTD